MGKLTTILICSFIFFSHHKGICQETCGTFIPTEEQYQAYREKLINFFAQEQLTTSTTAPSTVNYEIPLHIYFIYDDNGNLPGSVSSFQEGINGFAKGLAYVNEGLHESISFYICQIDEIHDSWLYNLQQPFEMTSHLQENYPDLLENNAIPVFLNNEDTGVGGFPDGIKFPAGSYSPGFMLHEFGHYFGLYHPFVRTTRPSPSGTGSCIALFPGHIPNTECPIPYSGFPDCPDLNFGKCYGDFIADTPVDVYCDNVSLADLDCIREVNGESHTYHPDYYNAMSYWFNTRIRLVEEQKQRIFSILENPDIGEPPYGGDMSFLIDDDVPICDDIEVDIGIAPVGYVDQVKYSSETEQYMFTPYKHGIIGVNLTFNNVTTHVPIRIREGIYPVYSQYGALDSPLDFSSNDMDLVNDDYLKANYNVNIFDMVRIARSIVGQGDLSRPYNWIAADVNHSGMITVLDLIDIRNVLLGISDNFSIPSWRFLPKLSLNPTWGFSDYFHENPSGAIWNIGSQQHAYLDGEHPSYLGGTSSFSTTTNVLHFPLGLSISTDVDQSETWSFYAIKTGDVTDEGEEEDSDEVIVLHNPIHPCLETGKRYSLVFKSQNTISDVEGLQLEFNIDTDYFTDSKIGNSNDNLVSPDEINLSNKKIRLVWLSKGLYTGENIEAGDAIFQIEISPSEQLCNISEIIQLAESTFNMGSIAIESGGKYFQKRLKNLHLELEIQEYDNEHRLLEIYPNPIDNNFINGIMSLNSDASVSIHLFDVFGNSIYQELGEYDQGIQYLPSISLEDLAPGYIFYVLQIGEDNYYGSLVKI